MHSPSKMVAEFGLSRLIVLGSRSVMRFGGTSTGGSPRSYPCCYECQACFCRKHGMCWSTHNTSKPILLRLLRCTRTPSMLAYLIKFGSKKCDEVRINRDMNHYFVSGEKFGECSGKSNISFIFNAQESLGGNQNPARAPSARVFLCPSAHLLALLRTM